MRGLLALTVVIYHHPLGGQYVSANVGHWCVGFFFIISGIVLSRSYDGHYWLFVIRRLFRLWPLFAFCTIMGAWLKGLPLQLGELLMLPNFLPCNGHVLIDPPAWSLFLEAWASFILPLFILVARRSVFALFITSSAIWYATPLGWFVAMFAYGTILGQFNLHLPSVKWKPLLWLGKISFPLYLSHWLVNDTVGLWWAIPLYLPVAYVLHKFVETPTLAFSRQLYAYPIATKPKVV